MFKLEPVEFEPGTSSLASHLLCHRSWVQMPLVVASILHFFQVNICSRV